MRQHNLAYLIEPRFPGGTSSALAAELAVTAGTGRVSIHPAETSMFDGRSIAPQLVRTLNVLGLECTECARTIGADIVVIHNPAFLKFEKLLSTHIVARHVIAVTHENFLRPGGEEGFDVAHCLSLIDRSTLSLRKSVAPISPNNRATVEEWAARHGLPSGWDILPEDWINICDFDMAPPTDRPRDRRGRHSRPGPEKFPKPATLDLIFPSHAEANVILGADMLIAGQETHPHWTLHPFRGLDVARFFEMIDFMVYFTAPGWRESFGRVLAEGIAAGKVVISDRETAAGFDGAVIGAEPEEVDGIIRLFIAEPERYISHVRSAQTVLSRFSPEAFRDRFLRLTGLGAPTGAAA
ncbi:hypothetical protein DEA8626_02385 [Defluviimonas aquaemixtae]|uniref:Glycosyl transferase family 1 domain-containing protein n=1 Tax=Albidovulum aquaemixtae TaxID=1542388 RepID=A0A2R8BJ33_9RHOB|nr:glycosyltransferase family 1 protein [Defluviimonas aquaemixtae]SPH23321.1 hypothetical protein DEA8626_02385 [Defluviimonas aquaemixtae]